MLWLKPEATGKRAVVLDDCRDSSATNCLQLGFDDSQPYLWMGADLRLTGMLSLPWF